MVTLDEPLATVAKLAPSPPARGTALVVDDEITQRMLLKNLLTKEGFEVLLAENGKQALEIYSKDHPDIIFMDVVMPGINGYETSQLIKQQAGEEFIPIIFLTALTEEDALVQSVRSGGDEFLTKPVRLPIFKAKIIAMERIRDLYRRIHRQHLELSTLHNQMQWDQAFAEKIFSGAVNSNNVATSAIQTLLRPTSTFSGDLVLTAHPPSGGLHVLLGDFTGHGLAAAIGALPVSEVFRSMTTKGFSPMEILSEINHKLKSLLPTGMFLSVCFVRVEKNLSTALIWNAGMPDVIVARPHAPRIRHRIVSSHLPLGINSQLTVGRSMEIVDIDPGDRLLLYSDGLIEASDHRGVMFGSERLEACIEDCPSPEQTFSQIVDSLSTYTEGGTLHDDVTLVVVPCTDEVVHPPESEPRPTPLANDKHNRPWRWSLLLSGSSLQSVDPVPLALSQLRELRGLHQYQSDLFTILTELYQNAVDHGLLELDSSLKDSSESFAQFYVERDRRLHELQSGHVRLELENIPDADDGYLVLRVVDSGKGFNYTQAPGVAPTPIKDVKQPKYSGRGIALVKKLCRSVTYSDCGNTVEAHFAWNPPEENTSPPAAEKRN